LFHARDINICIYICVCIRMYTYIYMIYIYINIHAYVYAMRGEGAIVFMTGVALQCASLRKSDSVCVCLRLCVHERERLKLGLHRGYDSIRLHSRNDVFHLTFILRILRQILGKPAQYCFVCHFLNVGLVSQQAGLSLLAVKR